MNKKSYIALRGDKYKTFDNQVKRWRDSKAKLMKQAKAIGVPVFDKQQVENEPKINQPVVDPSKTLELVD